MTLKLRTIVYTTLSNTRIHTFDFLGSSVLTGCPNLAGALNQEGDSRLSVETDNRTEMTNYGRLDGLKWEISEWETNFLQDVEAWF
jgi:hypothetical protein